MKFFRIIAAVLILAMASGPALAAVCATSCVAGVSSMAVAEQDSSVMVVGDMTADHCHQATPEPSKHQPGTDYKGCTMAGGCHFSQAAPLVLTAQIPATNFSDTTLPHFSPSEVCADLPPPIKPPA